jgi:hypothetical protein
LTFGEFFDLLAQFALSSGFFPMASGKQRVRRTEVCRLARCAADAGLPIKQWRLQPDGTVVFDFGAGGSASVPGRDTSWDDLKEDDEEE